MKSFRDTYLRSEPRPLATAQVAMSVRLDAPSLATAPRVQHGREEHPVMTSSIELAVRNQY